MAKLFSVPSRNPLPENSNAIPAGQLNDFLCLGIEVIPLPPELRFQVSRIFSGGVHVFTCMNLEALVLHLPLAPFLDCGFTSPPILSTNIRRDTSSRDRPCSCFHLNVERARDSCFIIVSCRPLFVRLLAPI